MVVENLDASNNNSNKYWTSLIITLKMDTTKIVELSYHKILIILIILCKMEPKTRKISVELEDFIYKVYK